MQVQNIQPLCRAYYTAADVLFTGTVIDGQNQSCDIQDCEKQFCVAHGITLFRIAESGRAVRVLLTTSSVYHTALHAARRFCYCRKEGIPTIKARDAIAEARKLIGTPYAELDCINLIKAVIRKAPGGEAKYTTAGSNSLWDSYWKSGKYKDLTERATGILGAKAGMLAFKAQGEDYHHVGIITDAGTVIHSSSTQGGRGVVETPLTSAEGWTHLARHRLIETSSAPAGHLPLTGEGSGTEESGDTVESYKAKVRLSNPDSTLNVRNAPSASGDVINRLTHGQSVNVLAQYDNGWMFVQYGDSGKSGYVSGEYIERDDTPQENVIRIVGTPVIIDGEGNEFFPIGGWRVEIRTDD